MVLKENKEKKELIQLKKTIDEIFELHKVHPYHVSGCYDRLPEVKPFANYMYLCGTPLDLYDITFSDNLTKEERQISREFNSFLDKMKIDMKENSGCIDVKDKYMVQLKDWYEKILNIGLNHGRLYMIDESYRYDKEAVAKSLYIDSEINFSPYVLCIKNFNFEHYITELSSYLSNAYLSYQFCPVFMLYFHDRVSKKDIRSISEAMEKIFKEMNDYEIARFHKEKKSRKYMHRCDFDPEQF